MKVRLVIMIVGRSNYWLVGCLVACLSGGLKDADNIAVCLFLSQSFRLNAGLGCQKLDWSVGRLVAWLLWLIMPSVKSCAVNQDLCAILSHFTRSRHSQV